MELNFIPKLTRVEAINLQICAYKSEIDTGDISDTHHTFGELYYHRMVLFSIICNQNKNKAWKSKLHDDGTMFEDYFIVGISSVEGDFTYHYHTDNWDYFDVRELATAPKWLILSHPSYQYEMIVLLTDED